jgi:homocitrate synthase NifV
MMSTREYIQIVDTTLRDGEQAPGISFSHREKLLIAEELAACGVNEIEAGTPAMGAAEQAVIRDIVRMNTGCDVTAWCRARMEDVELAEQCAVESIHISFPASSVHLQVLGWGYDTLLLRMDDLLDEVVPRFRRVSIGLQDVGRTPPSILMKLVNVAYGHCVDRIRLADSVGVWNPDTVRRTVKAACHRYPDVEMGVHTHNDLGMATANAVTAVLAGATSIDTTVTGIGERAGNAAMEQVVVALQAANGPRTTIKPERLYALCHLVASKTGRMIPDDQPVVGRNAFRHETGIHVHALIQQRDAYEAFDPSLVGRAGDIDVVAGKHSGRASLQYIFSQMGIELERGTVQQLLPMVRSRAEAKHGPLDTCDLMELYHSLASSGNEACSISAA